MMQGDSDGQQAGEVTFDPSDNECPEDEQDGYERDKYRNQRVREGVGDLGPGQVWRHSGF